MRRLCLASVLFGLTILAPSIARADEPQISEDAKQHFKAGVSLLQDPEGEKVEEAYREFRTAYDLSGSVKILGNMGFCAMRLERDGEAIDAYSRYIREVTDIDPDERAQIVRDLQTLTVGVVRVTIEVNKPGVTVLDERVPIRGMKVTNAYGPIGAAKKIEIGVRPGHHVLTAKLAGHDEATWEVEAHAGSKETYTFTMKEAAKPVIPGPPGAEKPEKSSNVGPWIAMGTGAALLVAGTITGVIALGKTNDIEDRCQNDTCPRSFNLDDERASAKTFVRVTDVLLISGAVVALGGAGWLLFSGSSDTKPKSAWRTIVPALAGGKVSF